MRLPPLQRRMRTPFRSFIREDIAILVEDSGDAKELLGVDPGPGAPFPGKRTPEKCAPQTIPDPKLRDILRGCVTSIAPAGSTTTSRSAPTAAPSAGNPPTAPLLPPPPGPAPPFLPRKPRRRSASPAPSAASA